MIALIKKHEDILVTALILLVGIMLLIIIGYGTHYALLELWGPNYGLLTSWIVNGDFSGR